MRYLFMACASIMLVACSAQNEKYYRTNPQALQKALRECPETHPSQATCEQLAVIATKMNELVFQLQLSPQAFGKRVLALQTRLAAQRNDLKTNDDPVKLEAAIKDNEQQLAEHLAIVKWLEAPES